MKAPLMLSVSGCRGIVGESLTPDVAATFAAAYGAWLVERAKGPVTVVVGRDGRAGGDVIHRAAMAGLVSAGCAPVDIGVAMTPTVAVMTDVYAQRAGKAAGMVVTASQHPQAGNGLKCPVGGGGGVWVRGVRAPAWLG